VALGLVALGQVNFGITETEITGVGTRGAGTNEFRANWSALAPSTAFGHNDRKKRALTGRHEYFCDEYFVTYFVRLLFNFTL
jgi:hypothetical protein